ncbi:hypothetical protein [Hymenobacter baengnokdamensis]|uniref:hypothetical protein n=1 Tax=Hymenobacter baengnokdamensis TaxID=2615203 RepID=UPI0012457FBD|nr:hypothetical protein [Hymenobacter baengnokdamensis]
MDTQDLTHTSGTDNTPGIQQKIFYTTLENIVTLPKPTEDDSAASTGTFADLVTITADIVVKKPLSSIYVTLEDGELKHSGQGETDSMSFKNELEFAHPGTKPEQLGFAQWCKNSNLIFLVPEVDGQIRVLGTRGYPAKLATAPGSTGKKSTDGRKTTFTFHSSRKGPAPVFTGKVMVAADGGGDPTEQDLGLED